jgi:DNA-binding PadR family transcriptional regulator
MAVAHVVLGALLGGEASGYRTWVRVGARRAGARRIESSLVYATLAELERAGWVVGRNAACRSGTSRLFRLTDDGRQAIAGWLEQPVAAGEWRRLALVKAVLAGMAGEWRGVAADLDSRRRRLRGLTSAPPERDRDEPAVLARLERARERRHLEIEIAALEAALGSEDGAGAAGTVSSPPRRQPPASESR